MPMLYYLNKVKSTPILKTYKNLLFSCVSNLTTTNVCPSVSPSTNVKINHSTTIDHLIIHLLLDNQ